jgi:Tol biopolymer transport system component
MNARGIARITVAIAVAIAVADGSVHGQQTARASVDAAGNESDGASDRQSISADGRWVVFQSIASNLVAGDANGFYDVFVRDLTTGTVERISVDSAGTEADGSSGVTSSRATSADGMVVAFSSLASNLVAGDVNLALDVFVRDRVAGTTEMVSVDRQGNPGDAQSFDGTVSADGRFVAFDSLASNLVTGDQNHVRDVFVRDRATGVTERVSVDSFGQEATADSLRPSLSLDGRYVAFMSFARDLDPNDFNSDADVFVRDRLLGTTECVSVDLNGLAGDDWSEPPSISGDGNLVAFHSNATNLVAGDTNHWCDVFVRDRAAATTTRVSVDAGGNEADGFSVRPVISADGRVVAFESLAENLVSGDSNSSVDFFLHALVTGYTERISVDSNGHQSESSSENVSLSGDGRTAAFDSAAASLVASDDNGVDDVFVHTSAALPASWANYDAGFPGTYGVPTITARDLPIPGATLTVDVGNSYARPTWGVLLVGTARATIPTNRDGVILVDAGVVDPITFSYSSDSFTGTLPFDFSLIGTTLNLQALENDPGAAKGVSFTPGLELVLGW